MEPVTAPAAVVDLVATGVALVAMIALHLVPTGLSAIRDPVSRYGIGRYRHGYRVLTLALGTAGLASAWAVATAHAEPQRSSIVVLFVVFGLSRTAISWWPMDLPGRSRSASGTMHVVLAVAAFLSVTAAAERLRHTTALLNPGSRTACGVAFWLLAGGLSGLLIVRRLGVWRRFLGVSERVVYAGIFVLLFAAGAGLL